MAPPAMSRQAIAAPDKTALLKRAPGSAPVRVIKTAHPVLFQLLIKAQLEYKKACKQNADDKVQNRSSMRLAGDSDAERPQRNHALEHKADAYMAQVKL